MFLSFEFESFERDFLDAWNRLDKYIDKCDTKAEEAEEAEDYDKADRWNRKYDKARAEQAGMRSVLEMLGYKVDWSGYPTNIWRIVRL